MSEEDVFKRYALKSEDPLRFLKDLVDRTVSQQLQVFRVPPESSVKAIKMGCFHVFSYLLTSPGTNIQEMAISCRVFAEGASEQANVDVNFDELFRECSKAIARIRDGDFELRREFGAFLQNLFMESI